MSGSHHGGSITTAPHAPPSSQNRLATRIPIRVRPRHMRRIGAGLTQGVKTLLLNAATAFVNGTPLRIEASSLRDSITAAGGLARWITASDARKRYYAHCLFIIRNEARAARKGRASRANRSGA
jgi:hypothetical protein